MHSYLFVHLLCVKRNEFITVVFQKQYTWLTRKTVPRWRIYVIVQLNHVTSWIDGNFIYGRGEVWASALRAYVGGQLATTNSTVNFPALNTARIPLDNYPSPTTNSPFRLEDHWGQTAHACCASTHPRLACNLIVSPSTKRHIQALTLSGL